MSSMGSPGASFFGSMMPPQGGSPSSFTSPPIDPKILALLASLGQQGQQGQQQQQGPSALPPNATLAPGASIPGQNPQQPGQQPPADQMNGMQQAVAGGGQNPQLMAALMQLSKLAPDQQKAIMARLGIGAPAGAQ